MSTGRKLRPVRFHTAEREGFEATNHTVGAAWLPSRNHIGIAEKTVNAPLTRPCLHYSGVGFEWAMLPPDCPQNIDGYETGMRRQCAILQAVATCSHFRRHSQISSTQGPDGPECADFHALRHSYLTLLGKGGVNLRSAQELAGHSTPLLTARYVHRRLYDFAGTADKLPNFLPDSSPRTEAQPLRITGTDAVPFTGKVRPLTGGPLAEMRFPALSCTADALNKSKPETTQPPESSEGCADIHPVSLPCTRVSDGIRTRDVRNHNCVFYFGREAMKSPRNTGISA